MSTRTRLPEVSRFRVDHMTLAVWVENLHFDSVVGVVDVLQGGVDV